MRFPLTTSMKAVDFRSTFAIVVVVLVLAGSVFTSRQVASRGTGYGTVRSDSMDKSPTCKPDPKVLKLFGEAAAKGLGIVDAEVLANVLSALFQRSVVSGSQSQRAIVDIGMNNGRTSRKMLDMFTLAGCIRDENSDGVFHGSCGDRNMAGVVIGLEPIPITFEYVERRATAEQWARGSWIGIRAAVGDEDRKTQFYSAGKAGDEQASQDDEAADSGNSLNVTMVKMDSLFLGGWQKLSSKPKVVGDLTTFNAVFVDRTTPLDIFLLKIDAEGYDYTVLHGAEQLIKKGKVRFIVFEYNSKWFTQGRNTTLHDVTVALHQQNMMCFFITDSLLFPISGAYWAPDFEIKEWSNILCGRTGDAGLKWTVDSFNGREQPTSLVDWSCFGGERSA